MTKKELGLKNEIMVKKNKKNKSILFKAEKVSFQ